MSVSWIDFASGASRSMPRAALDRELSPSHLVESIDDELARYAALSEAARVQGREAGTLREGLAYGDEAAQRIDLFTPAAKERAPVLIYLHGGFWQMLSRRDSAFAAPGVVAAGGALAVVGYTLAPAATLRQIVAQVRAAVAWLYREADALGLDRDRFVIAGSSAGAHLAAMVQATDWPSLGLPANLVRGACLVSGVYDLAAVQASYVDQPLRLGDDDVADLSPLRLAAGGRDAAVVPANGEAAAAAQRFHTLIACGDNETAEFKRESRVYAERLRDSGLNVAVQQIAGRHHFDVILDIDKADTLLGHSALSLLGLTRPSS